MAIGKKRNIKKAIGISVLICILLSCLSSCGFGKLGPNYMHFDECSNEKEFEELLKVYNTKHRSFLSFDFDNSDKINKSIYRFYVIYNHDKYLFDGAYYDYKGISEAVLYFCFASNSSSQYEDLDENDFEIECLYSQKGIKIENVNQIKIKPDEQANSKIKDKFKNDSMGIINDYEYEYVIYVGDEKYMDMRISTVRQLSNQELSKLLDMLMDSVVVID